MEELTFTLKDLVAFGGLFVAGLSVLFGAVKWLISRQDKRDEKIEEEFDRVRATSARAHQRLDDLPNVYIQRQEVMEHFKRLEASQTDMRGEMNQRLDRIIQMISGKKD